MNNYYDGPVWNAFGLTYATYAVFPRRALQSMPVDWQEKFVALVNEMHASLPDGTFDADYSVQTKRGGKFARDPLREYRHAGPLEYKAPA